MINLYRILRLPPHASEAEILSALKNRGDRLDNQITHAINQWLLEPEVRARYNAQLKQSEPHFFPPDAPQKNTASEEYEIDDSESEEDYVNLPPLWSPRAAVVWSLLLTGIFGAVIQAMNWSALGEQKWAMWNYAFALLFLVLLTSAVMMMGIQLIQIIPIGFIVWYIALGRRQIAYFKQYLDNGYEQREWFAPIVMCISAIIMWFIILIILD